MEDVQVRTDQELLLRLFRNLLINAVRHTETGAVSCRAWTEGDRVELRIADTGEGIAVERQQQLFDTFQRLERHRTGFAGAGLGLSIVGKISAVLNLQLSMTSTPGQGTEFRFQLHRAR
ncbi:MAG: ATP-binding protein [Halioglobus sp.]